MKVITCWADLRDYGIDYLTGEACGLSYRILFDVTKRGKHILEKCFGIPNMNLPESWNAGSKSDPHVGSIMLARDMYVPIAVFALLESTCKEVWLLKDECLRGIESHDSEEYIELHRKLAEEDKSIIRVFSYHGTAGDRNIHEMTGRIT